jgi:hypothetical protein
MTLIERLKTKQLLFNAGGIVDVGPIAVSTVTSKYKAAEK